MVRFGISLPGELQKRFDRLIKEKGYANRSEALRDLMREMLVRKEWERADQEVAGTITLVYNHHQRELVSRLTEIQHNYHQIIISGQHVHLDHDNCLEVVIMKGRASQVLSLGQRLRAVKGVKFGEVTMASTGRTLK